MHGFKNLLQYDIGGTVPVMMSSISHQSLGLAEIDDAVFAFDFRHNKLYVQSGIRQLLLFDLGKRTIQTDLSWPGSQLSAINQIYFNKTDNLFYLAGEKFDPQNRGDSNFIFRLEKDSLLYSNVATPKNATNPDNLYPGGMHTAVNQMPAGSFAAINGNISLTKNLALIPHSENEYLLYNARSGNMIHSFRAANVDLRIGSRYSVQNTAILSPDGRFIFEWLIKAGIVPGLADTLQTAITGIESGIIRRNQLILTEEDGKKITHFSWDDKARPLFTQISSGIYPEKRITLFYLDSTLQPHELAVHRLAKPDVLYDA